MELSLSIPALLFPAISLTMLAYNARYLAIAALIRQLHQKYQETAYFKFFIGGNYHVFNLCRLQVLGELGFCR